MSTQRRFSEEEVGKIFEHATRVQNEASDKGHSKDGLTLEDLQQIGKSTGIDPAYIAQAVVALGKDSQNARVKKHLGIPFEVSREIELPATFSEKDWESLVVHLREIFKGRGEIKQNGSFREWSYKNTHAFVEPAANGFKLKIESKSGDMKALLYAGLLYIFAAFFFYALLSGEPDPNMTTIYTIFSLILAGGLGMFVSPFIKQPRWVKKRESQLEEVCTRVAAAMNTAPEQDLSSPSTEVPAAKFLTLEDEEDLNNELKQFAARKKTR